MHLHRHLESVDDGDITFSDDLPERLAAVESIFGQRSGRAIDTYIAAAGIDAPAQQAAPADKWLSSDPAQLNLADARITSVLWTNGYKLDSSFIDTPVVDEWGYPKPTKGVTEIPGLFVRGLPWLTRHYTAIVWRRWVGYGLRRKTSGRVPTDLLPAPDRSPVCFPQQESPSQYVTLHCCARW